jgi:hypothetical protein
MMIAVILVGSNIIPGIGITGLGGGINGASIGDMNMRHVNTTGIDGTDGMTMTRSNSPLLQRGKCLVSNQTEVAS